MHQISIIKAMSLDIKRAIKEKGLEVKDVAARMGISSVGLSQHINGNPSVAVLERIAEAVGCEVRDFFTTSSPNEEQAITCPHCKRSFKAKITIVED